MNTNLTTSAAVFGVCLLSGLAHGQDVEKPGSRIPNHHLNISIQTGVSEKAAIPNASILNELRVADSRSQPFLITPEGCVVQNPANLNPRLILLPARGERFEMPRGNEFEERSTESAIEIPNWYFKTPTEIPGDRLALIHPPKSEAGFSGSSHLGGQNSQRLGKYQALGVVLRASHTSAGREAAQESERITPVTNLLKRRIAE